MSMLRTISLGLVIGSLAFAGCSSSDSSGSGGSTSKGGTSGKGGSGGSTGGKGGTGGTGGSTGGTGGSTGGTGGSTGGTAGSSAGGTAGSSAGGTAGSSAGGTAGAAGGTNLESAAQFCGDYSTQCTFGPTGHYTSMDDCTSKYDSFSSDRKACVIQHLGFAAGDPTSIHCTHATGIAPCN